MIPSTLLIDLDLLEETSKVYIYGKTHYLGQPKAFNFSLLKSVLSSIQLLPLDKETVEVMKRYRNVLTQLASFHPKLVYLYDFDNEINIYRQLDSLQEQAVNYFKRYFEVNKPTFDWEGLSDLRKQISKVQNSSYRIDLMKAFEYGVLNTVSQVKPRTYSDLTFHDELEEINPKDSSTHSKTR
ncbi:hypothetical protein [Legionella sp. WA2022007384]